MNRRFSRRPSRRILPHQSGNSIATCTRQSARKAPGLADAAAILVVRPDADVLVSPANVAMRAIFAELEDFLKPSVTFGHFDEPDCKGSNVGRRLHGRADRAAEVGALIRAD